MHKELEIRAIEAQKSKPTWLIAVAGGLVLVVGILGFWAYNRSQQADKEKAEAAAHLKQLQDSMNDAQTKYDSAIKEVDDKYQKLLAAKTDSEKAAAQAALDDAKRKQAAQ